MVTLITGGTGLLGSKVARRLVGRGQRVVCFDPSPNTAAVSDLGTAATAVKGDQMVVEDLVAAIQQHKVEQLLNLTYVLGAECIERPHAALRFNVVGVNNVLEAARLTGVRRVVMEGSIAVYGLQSHFGDRPLSEVDDVFRKPVFVYTATRQINEFMAETYRTKYGIDTVVVRGSIMHDPWKVAALTAWAGAFATLPARGLPMRFPYRAEQKNCIISMDDGAELVARICAATQLRHAVYNMGGHCLSNQALASLVQRYLPDANFSYSDDAPEQPLAYMIDGRRVKAEFGFEPRPMEDTVLEHINAVRRADGLPPVTQEAARRG